MIHFDVMYMNLLQEIFDPVIFLVKSPFDLRKTGSPVDSRQRLDVLVNHRQKAHIITFKIREEFNDKFRINIRYITGHHPN